MFEEEDHTYGQAHRLGHIILKNTVHSVKMNGFPSKIKLKSPIDSKSLDALSSLVNILLRKSELIALQHLCCDCLCSVSAHGRHLFYAS